MRVIGGYHKGRILKRVGKKSTRETADMVKESVFNMIQGKNFNCVLDLFAGSGAYGLEALSRGAKYLYAVDHDKDAIKCVFENARILDVAEHMTILERDYKITFACPAQKNEKAIKLILDGLKEQFSFITSLLYVVNNKANDTIYDLPVHNHSGESYIEEKLGDYTFMVRPKSFFQTNTEQAKVLYETAKNLANIQPDETVYDLYTGTGSIAIYNSAEAKKIVGIESVEDAIKDAIIYDREKITSKEIQKLIGDQQKLRQK